MHWKSQTHQAKLIYMYGNLYGKQTELRDSTRAQYDRGFHYCRFVKKFIESSYYFVSVQSSTNWVTKTGSDKNFTRLMLEKVLLQMRNLLTSKYENYDTDQLFGILII